MIWGALNAESKAFRQKFVKLTSPLPQYVKETFGSPLDKTDKTALYTWWPKHKAELPLHCFLATMVLGGVAPPPLRTRSTTLPSACCTASTAPA